MITNLNRYQLIINSNDYRCISVNGKSMTHFISPDTEPKIQKLYVLKNSNEIYYVGVTSLPLSSRLRMGYKANGEQGYHGYKWIGKISKTELLVWCFSAGNREVTESIEGELVYLIRNKTGNWPKYQMEIHFHPDATKQEKQVALSICNVCLES